MTGRLPASSLSIDGEENLTQIRAGRVGPLANFPATLGHAVAGGPAGCRRKKSSEGVLLAVPRASPCAHRSSKACLAPLPRRRKSSNILEDPSAQQGIERTPPPASGKDASKGAEPEHRARFRLEPQTHRRELRVETARASVVGGGAERECRGGAASTLRRAGLGGASRRRRSLARAPLLQGGVGRSGMGGGEGERAAARGRGALAGRVVVAWQVFLTLVTGPSRSLNLKLSDTRVYEPQIRAWLVRTTSPQERINSPFSPKVDSLSILSQDKGLVKL